MSKLLKGQEVELSLMSPHIYLEWSNLLKDVHVK